MRVFLHNPRCSKSRDALKLMTKSGKNFVLRNYIKAPLDIGELEDLQKKL
jgi:arsenate reductase (glutaredoxin)